MTTIVIGLEALSGTDPGIKPIGGYFQVYPYAAEKLTSGGYLTTAILGVTVVNGTASVVIPPTGAGEAVVFNPVNIRGLSQRIVAIPDSDTPVSYEDLVDLDPSTLDPAAPLTPAWLVALQDWKLSQLADVAVTGIQDGQVPEWNEAQQKFIPGSGGGGGSGTVTSVSVESANGFGGAVATPGTTPAITMKVTFSGIAKGNGAALSAADAADIISTLGYTPASASAIPASTDQLPQGTNNLYFSDTLAQAAQVQPDWNAASGKGEILNKPTIPTAQVNSDWDASSGVAEILNKPTIPAAQINSDWNASSGVAQILNKPAIPAAQVQTDWNATSGLGVLLNRPGIATPAIIGLSKPDGSTIVIAEDGTLSVPAPINIATLSSDAALAVGQQAYIDITAATTVPLMIATGDKQRYKINLSLDWSIASFSGNLGLLPNNQSYTNFFLFQYAQWYGETSLSSSNGAGYYNNFAITTAIPQSLEIIVDTSTLRKRIFVDGSYSSSTPHAGFVKTVCMWLATASAITGGLDTTTAYASLGTLVNGGGSMTGRAVVTRLI